MSEAVQSLKRIQIFGLAVVVLLIGGIGGWAAVAEIAGAVIASGQVVVESSAKKVQHLEGGLVSELNVREGDHVDAGDLLMRLDATDTRANLGMVNAQLDELLVQQARYAAERDNLKEFSIPEELAQHLAEPKIASIVSGQKRLLQSRRQSMIGQKAQLSEQIRQIEKQVDGLTSQKRATLRQRDITTSELSDLQSLEGKGLVQKSRLLRLERDIARLDGEAGRLEAETARLRGAISETELKKIQLDDERRSEALTALAQIRTQIASLSEQKSSAEGRLNRIEIVAPQAGTVHQLAVHTIGGVIGAGEPIMLLVPDGEELVVRARVEPANVDQVAVGQAARLRFPAFDQRTTPELLGSVTRVGADLTIDQVTGMSFYEADIHIAPNELEKLGGQALRPGMPVETFITSGRRSALSYLLKPLRDQIEHAFRET